ncbi:MAG: LysM peptidoglycan-binding domain-containing protein [Candidatus Coatesbacteria bacterium]|nr:LysM peptidoglycan-binding domain-containing protein [Candidatus Coatesbacteria bacterium]
MGWEATDAPWYMRGTLVTFQGRDNATVGKVVVFDFNPKRDLSDAEKHDRMMASITRQVYPMHQIQRRKLVMPWGEALEVICHQQVEADGFIYRIWLVTAKSHGFAIVCRTSDLLYELVRDEIGGVFTSFRLVGADAVQAEIGKAREQRRQDLRTSMASLEKQFAAAARRVSEASTGDAKESAIDGLRSHLEALEKDIARAKQLLESSRLEECADLTDRLGGELADIATQAAEQGYIIHRIRCEGETLFAIAGWYSGDPNNWRRISDFNKDLDPSTLRIGDEIRIPLYLGLTTREPMECTGSTKRRGEPKKREKKKTEEMEPVGPK